jgi:hypothetical protein
MNERAIELFFNEMGQEPGSSHTQVRLYFNLGQGTTAQFVDFLAYNATGILIAEPGSAGNDKKFYPWSSVFYVTR